MWSIAGRIMQPHDVEDWRRHSYASAPRNLFLQSRRYYVL